MEPDTPKLRDHYWCSREGEQWVTGRFQALVREDEIVSQDQKVRGPDFICLERRKTSFDIYESTNLDPHFTSGLCVLIHLIVSHCICSVLVLSTIHTSDDGVRKLGEIELRAEKGDTISMDICFGNSFC